MALIHYNPTLTVRTVLEAFDVNVFMKIDGGSQILMRG